MISGTVRVRLLRIAGGCVAALLLTFVAFRLGFNLSSATSLHLFLVAAIALRWGLMEASAVSLLCVACLDYFFTAPLFAFYMTDAHDWVALVTFEAAALLVSSLSNQANRHARESELHQAQLRKLYDLSQQILLLERDATVEQQVAQQIADLLRSTLHVDGVALWNVYDLHLCRSGVCALPDDDVRAIYYTETNGDDEAGRVARRVLRSGTRPIGALVLCGHSLDLATINAAASLAAVAMERARSFATEASAEAARQSEQLRAAILDGLAHAFKSPLTAILTSSSGLLAMDTLSGTEKRLVSLIDQQAAHLSELTTHLLLTAKFDSGDLKLKRESLDLNELVRRSAAASSAMLDGSTIEVCTARVPGLVYADRALIEMALLQLFDNAVKYGLPGSAVVAAVVEEEAELLITVTNEGSFIPAEEREKVFQRFYRSAASARSVSGTGIGLSVVRRITEAHKGRSWINSSEAAGAEIGSTSTGIGSGYAGTTTFAISLPRTRGEG